MGEKKASSDIGHAKRKILRTVEAKKLIIAKHKNGVYVFDLTAEHGMTKSTMSTLIKNNKVIKGADVAKEVTVINTRTTALSNYRERLSASIEALCK